MPRTISLMSALFGLTVRHGAAGSSSSRSRTASPAMRIAAIGIGAATRTPAAAGRHSGRLCLLPRQECPGRDQHEGAVGLRARARCGCCSGNWRAISASIGSTSRSSAPISGASSCSIMDRWARSTIRRCVYGRGSPDHRSEAGSIYGAQAPARAHAALVDRPIPLDRFRSGSDEAGSNLLTRFGQTVYLFFVITTARSAGREGRGSADWRSDASRRWTTRWRIRSKPTRACRMSFHLGEAPRQAAYNSNSWTTRCASAIDRAPSPSANSSSFNVWTWAGCSTSSATAASTSTPRIRSPSTPQGKYWRLKELRLPGPLPQGIPPRQFCRSGHRAHLPASGRRPSGLGDREPLHAACSDADVMAGIKTVAAPALGVRRRQVDAARYLGHHLAAPTLGEWGLGISRPISREPV